MISVRLKSIAKFVDSNDSVLDVGCDHGYLSIYLKENNLCKNIYASDISKNALEIAKNNFQKHNVLISTFLSDGFRNIDVYFDTAIIAGVGTNTILNIMNSNKRPAKLILASNNDYYLLRKSLNKKGYKLIDELVVKENNHYYIIMKYILGKQKLSYEKLLFGISNDKDYYQYLFKKNNDLIKKVPFIKKIKLSYENRLLKGLIERK